MFIDSDNLEVQDIEGDCETSVHFSKPLLFKTSVKKESNGYEGKLFKITIERYGSVLGTA
jgi:hypothetical protein